MESNPSEPEEKLHVNGFMAIIMGELQCGCMFDLPCWGHPQAQILNCGVKSTVLGSMLGH